MRPRDLGDATQSSDGYGVWCTWCARPGFLPARQVLVQAERVRSKGCSAVMFLGPPACGCVGYTPWQPVLCRVARRLNRAPKLPGIATSCADERAKELRSTPEKLCNLAKLHLEPQRHIQGRNSLPSGRCCGFSHSLARVGEDGCGGRLLSSEPSTFDKARGFVGRLDRDMRLWGSSKVSGNIASLTRFRGTPPRHQRFMGPVRPTASQGVSEPRGGSCPRAGPECPRETHQGQEVP